MAVPEIHLASNVLARNKSIRKRIQTLQFSHIIKMIISHNKLNRVEFAMN